MKARKELQAEIESLQNQLKIVETLCKYVPEKYAICFDGMVVDSGYSMGEVVRYSIKGEIIKEVDYCQDYAPSCRFTAKHGLIIFDFRTRKQLKEYCEACGVYSELCNHADSFRRKIIAFQKNIKIARYEGNLKKADELQKETDEYSERLKNTNAAIIEQVRRCRAMLLAVYDEKHSVVKSLNF